MHLFEFIPRFFFFFFLHFCRSCCDTWHVKAAVIPPNWSTSMQNLHPCDLSGDREREKIDLGAGRAVSLVSSHIKLSLYFLDQHVLLKLDEIFWDLNFKWNYHQLQCSKCCRPLLDGPLSPKRCQNPKFLHISLYNLTVSVCVALPI